MNDVVITIGGVALALAGMVGWLSVGAIRAAGDGSLYLVAELRLAQAAALALVFTAGAYLGVAVMQSAAPGAGLDAALAFGFLVVALTAMFREPPQALMLLAAAFVAHVVVDVAHRPGLLPHALLPPWFIVGCALHNAVLGALCYLPVLFRR